MTLELLICTIDKGIEKVPNVLLPPLHNVKYLVSWQCTNTANFCNIPTALQREDVKVVTMQGKGLSRNRNFSIENASSDICIICDDDCTYTEAYLQKVLEIFEAHPAVDLATFKMKSNTEHHVYPSFSFDLRQPQKDYFATSVEMAFRRKSIQGIVKFNELFGLGAPVLSAGEEGVFLLDVLNLNLHCEYFPYVIVEHNHPSSMSVRACEPSFLMSDGAYIRMAYPQSSFIRYIIKAKRVNAANHCGFFKALHYILKGASYIKKNTQA